MRAEDRKRSPGGNREEVKQGQLLFEYDLSSIQEDLAESQLELDRLKNEAASLTEQIATLEKKKRKRPRTPSFPIQ